MTTLSLMEAGIVGHLGAAASYFVLALLVVYWRNRTLSGIALAAVSLATVAWAGVSAYDLHVGWEIGRLAQALEIVRSGGWIVLLLSLLYWIPPATRSGSTLAMMGLCCGVAALGLLFGETHELGSLAAIVGHLSIALIGLTLVENVFRNSPPARVWSIRYLCFGAGAIFAYDFFLYSDALLFRRPDMGLLLARGMTNLLAAPLLMIYAYRDRAAGPRIVVSRQFAFHSATILGAGLYLLLMAAAGYYMRQFGGAWSSFLQAVFFFGAILLLLVPISSSTFRAYLRVAVEKSLFKYKYDYRQEWLRFINTTSATLDGQNLRERVIEAVCDIVESPDGALWLMSEPGQFSLAASWNSSRWNLDRSAAIGATSALALFLEQSRWIVSLDEYAATPQRYRGLSGLPEWLEAIPRGWLVIPLFHDDRLYGIMIVGRPRAQRALTWEDFDILKTVGSQAASILSQQDTSAALAEVRQFEAFNKRFAFVAHDIKNLVSQLSLILSNATKHRGNVDFQDDVIRTVRQSVDKMNRMLRQLHAEPREAASEEPVDLAGLLRDIVAQQTKIDRVVFLDVPSETANVRADEDRLKAMVDHLVQNALDAAGEDGRVDVRLKEAGETMTVEIEDNGPGMDPRFMRNRLFRPFDTTKRSGYGIGVYESREYARSLGGRLEVVSEPGRGTIMRVCLPTARAG
jgi:putative PEP-CTERM system histidine kinase